MYEFHTFMRLLWEELHDWGWTIQHPDTFIFYILCQQVEKYRFIQLKWVQSSCFQYGNGLRSPMKLRKARHLRRCDRPGRCRPSWPLQEPWRSHQIHPSKKGGPGWVAVSNMLVKGGAMRWHALMSFVVSMRRDNRNRKWGTPSPPPFLVQHFLLRAAHQHLQGSIPGEPQLDSVGLNSCSAIQWLQKLGTILASWYLHLSD